MAATTPAKSPRKTDFSTPTDTTVVAVRTVDAPRKLVWACHTEPKHVRQWLLGPDGWTMPVCEIDLRPGGQWHWVWRSQDGTQFGMTGIYKEIVAPEKLVNTENWGEDWPETLSTMVLTEKDGRTTITTTVLYPTRDARDAAIKTGMTDGWGRSYERLDEHLASLR